MARRNRPSKSTPAAEHRADAVSIDPVTPTASALQNYSTGAGILGRDSSVAFSWRRPRKLTFTEIDAITIDGIGRRGVSLRGWEATREWGRAEAVGSTLPAETTAKVLKWLEQRAAHLHLRERTADLQRERERHGDAAMIRAIGADTKTWRDPAPDPSAGVEATRVRSLRVLRGQGRDYRPTHFHGPASTDWGEDDEITITRMDLHANAADEQWGTEGLQSRDRYGETRVHATRYFRLATIDGRSDLDGVNQKLADLLAAGRGAARVAARPAIPFYKSKNMGAQLHANRTRARSAYNTAHTEASDDAPVLLDLTAGEELGYVAPPGSTNPTDSISAQGFLLAAAWGIPMTLLFGMSPGGLNSPGDAEERNWNNVVRSVQADLTPAVIEVYKALAVELAATTRALAAADRLKGLEDSAREREALADAVLKLELWFTWAPLRVLTATEEADYRKTVSEGHKIYLDMGVVRADEIRTSVFGSEGFTADLQVIDRSQDGEISKPIPVGTAQAALTITIAYYAGQLPAGPARALLAAIDPALNVSANAIIDDTQTAKNPVGADGKPIAPTPAAGPADPNAAAPALDAPPSDLLNDLATEPEVRRSLRVGKGTIARWVSEGKLKAYDMGNGRRCYRRSQIHTLFESDPAAQEAADAEVARLDALDS